MTSRPAITPETTAAAARLERLHHHREHPADTATIISAYQSGLSLSQVAAAHGDGRTPDTIRAILARAGIERRPPGRTPADTAEIIRLYQAEELTKTAIAAKTGYSRTTIHRALAQAGISARRHPVSPDQAAEILASWPPERAP